MGRIPLMLEIFINGLFILIYTLKKSKQVPELLSQLPMDFILTHALWLIPLILFTTLISNFLKSSGFEDFFRRYIFSVIIFVPLLITWGDLEFVYWLSAVHLFSTVISFYEKQETKKVSYSGTSSFLFRLKLAPAQVVLLSFGGWIILGSLVLMLPVSAAPGKNISFIDALFMATSSTCVTGLSSISLPDEFSIFGQMIMLLLAQVGGLGIMTLSSSMAVIMGKSLQMREQVIMQDVLDASGSEELLKLIVDIIRYTFIIEFIGAILLTVGFYQEGFEIGQSLYFGFYHSVMAFCNAGYALFNNNLEDFKFQPLISMTVAFLLIFGGIGFSVLKDIYETIKIIKTCDQLKYIEDISKITFSCTNVYVIDYFKDLINNSKIKRRYQDGVTDVLKTVFSDFWVEGTTKEMSGFYGVESKEGRSILNNLNTNFNAFCLLVKAVNRQIENIGRTDKTFNFSFKENRTLKEVERFLNALNHFKKQIFTKNNEDFINIIKVLKKLWDRGQKSEDNVQKKLEDYFEGDAKVEKIGGHGQKRDAFKGVDMVIEKDGKTYTAQVKPYSTATVDGDKVSLSDTGNVKPYNVNWLIFIQPKTNKILIFDNHPLQNENQYIFKLSSLLHEIE
jgi:hypothetical protein